MFFAIKHISLIVRAYWLINDNRLRFFMLKVFSWILWVVFILLLKDSLWEQRVNTSTAIRFEASILFYRYVFRKHKTTRLWSQLFMNMILSLLDVV